MTARHALLVLSLSAFLLTIPSEASAAFGEVVHKLSASDGKSHDGFGGALAMDGALLLVGAQNNNTFISDSGAAYLFDVASGLQLAKLTPNDGAPYDHFGSAVALGDGLALVGAVGDDDNGGDTGAAYLFDTQTGQQLHKLISPDAGLLAQQGSSVAIGNGVAVVGANGDNTNGYDAGAVFLYDAATGQQLHRLLAPDGDAYDRFGTSVAIAPGVVAVGAPGQSDTGKVYLFDPDSGDLIGEIDDPHRIAYQDEFGVSLSIEGNRLLIGASFEDHGVDSAGGAYIYDLGAETILHPLSAENPQPSWQVGTDVAIDGRLTLVGTGTGASAAYIFDTYTGEQVKLLTAPEVSSGFGSAVAADDGHFAIGSFRGVGGVAPGVVWVYRGVPEPAALPLLAALLSGVALHRRR